MKPFWRSMFIRLRGAPHLLESCFHATWNSFPPTTKEIHLFFENLVVTGIQGLQGSLMGIHHDTFLRCILENDFISSASKTYIHFCLSKGAKLWLIVKPSICSLCIAHFILTSTLHFHLNLIQPSTSSFFTRECAHGLDAFGMHLAHCLFKSQWIATHDAIRDIMYALA